VEDSTANVGVIIAAEKAMTLKVRARYFGYSIYSVCMLVSENGLLRDIRKYR
jgi:hypothetical protein